MTYQEIYQQSLSLFPEMEKEAVSFEIRTLMERCFHISRTDLWMYGGKEAVQEQVEQYWSALEQRKQGIPLQYILGEWCFFDLQFSVGPGVLIPRGETELLVEEAIWQAKSYTNPVIFDLCSGSGCIGITVAKHCPDAKVYAIEKSEKALEYLYRNAVNYNLSNLVIQQEDILQGTLNQNLPLPDMILSNPPYIPSKELDALQKEVQQEPSMALDGGEDGLLFYCAIREKWMPYLKENGFFALECGRGQAELIIESFQTEAEMCYTIKDYQQIDRIVCGFQKKIELQEEDNAD